MNGTKYGVAAVDIAWRPTGKQGLATGLKARVKYFTYHREILKGRHKGKIMITIADKKQSRLIVPEKAIRRYPK